jgi:hypothetical protein
VDLELTIEDARDLETALRLHLGELRLAIADGDGSIDPRRVERLLGVQRRLRELLDAPPVTLHIDAPAG